MLTISQLPDVFQDHGPAIILALLGIMLVWRGLWGERDGARGLLRRQVAMRGRIEGFRLVVFGLALLGSGFAVIWQAQWLLFLSIGIGVVEILESSTLIAFWERG